MAYRPETSLGETIDAIEKSLIALILAAMTILTFAGVVVRYIFASQWFAPVTEALGLPVSILWALEVTVFLFAWLVLLGASHAIKTRAHLGVDVVTSAAGPVFRRLFALMALAACVAFGMLMMKAAWDFWAPFANLPPTTGRWFPTGFDWGTRGQGWYEVVDTPMPGALQWMAGIFNEGIEYEKMPRLIPYFILPLSMALLFARIVEAGWKIVTGRADSLIAAHEVEDALADVQAGERR